MAEHNLIQVPEIILRLSKFLGIRQPHVTPALAETVQPVVVIGDVSHEQHGDVRDVAVFFKETINAAGDDNISVQIRNPLGSGVRAVLQELYLFGATGTAIMYYLEVARTSLWTGLYGPATPAGALIYCQNPEGTAQFSNLPQIKGFTKRLNAAGALGFFSGEPRLYNATQTVSNSIKFTTPIVLDPGMQLGYFNDTVYSAIGQGVAIMAWLKETPITR